MKNESNFEDWIKSPLGCEGGNINGNLWFFGLEFGGDNNNRNWSGSIPQAHASVSGGQREAFPDDHQYNTKLAKLHASMLGHESGKYRDVFHATHMFSGPSEDCAASDTYKGNIFTLAFKKEDSGLFGEEVQKLTGCANKQQYFELHRKHRFPMLRNWVKSHNPRVITCFGSSATYAKDYVRAFHTEEGDLAVLTKLTVDDVAIRWGLINANKTLLVVVPFPNYYKYS